MKKKPHAQITLPPLTDVNRIHGSLVEEPIHSRIVFKDSWILLGYLAIMKVNGYWKILHTDWWDCSKAKLNQWRINIGPRYTGLFFGKSRYSNKYCRADVQSRQRCWFRRQTPAQKQFNRHETKICSKSEIGYWPQKKDSLGWPLNNCIVHPFLTLLCRKRIYRIYNTRQQEMFFLFRPKEKLAPNYFCL